MSNREFNATRTMLANAMATAGAELDKLNRYSIDCDGLPFIDSDGVWLAYEDVVAQARAAQPESAAPSDDLPYRVAEFWSSANPGKKVRMLAEGDDIVQWAKRGDFIRWVDAPSATGTTGALDGE